MLAKLQKNIYFCIKIKKKHEKNTVKNKKIPSCNDFYRLHLGIVFHKCTGNSAE